MIEVTQKNDNGTVIILAQYGTEQEFGKAYWPSTITAEFSTSAHMVGKERVRLGGTVPIYVDVPIFKKVAYNSRGKILSVDYLLGLVRKYNTDWRYPYIFPWFPGSRRHRGSNMRAIRTTSERRAVYACTDQEEYAPKVRARRNVSTLPNSWDDYWRYTDKNWKSFRSHQWK